MARLLEPTRTCWEMDGDGIAHVTECPHLAFGKCSLSGTGVWEMARLLKPMCTATLLSFQSGGGCVLSVLGEPIPPCFTVCSHTATSVLEGKALGFLLGEHVRRNARQSDATLRVRSQMMGRSGCRDAMAEGGSAKVMPRCPTRRRSDPMTGAAPSPA
eukprot:gene12782-biopygen5655